MDMDLVAMAAAAIQQRRAANAVAAAAWPQHAGPVPPLQARRPSLPLGEKQALSLQAALDQSLFAHSGLLSTTPARAPAPAPPFAPTPAYIELGWPLDAGDAAVPAAALSVAPPPGLEDLLPAPGSSPWRQDLLPASGGSPWRQDLPDVACAGAAHVAKGAILSTRAAAAARGATVAAKPTSSTCTAQPGAGKRGGARAGKPQVPASVATAVAVAAASVPEPKPLEPLRNGETTVVVQNLSGRYGQEDLLRTWPADGSYDLVHLPYNLLQKRALGYVFINFATHELAVSFQQRWHGAMLPDGSNKRPLEVRSAEVQGRQANLGIMKTRKITQLEKAGYLPMLFEGKERVDAKAVVAHLERMRGMQGTAPVLKVGVLEAAKASASAGEDSGPSTPTTTSGLESCGSPLVAQGQSP